MMKKLTALLLAACMLLGACTANADDFEELLARFEEEMADKGGICMWVSLTPAEVRPWQEITGIDGTILDEAPEGWMSRDDAVELAIQQVIALDEPLYPQVWYGVKEPVKLTEELIRSLDVGAFAVAETEEGADVWYVFLYAPEWLGQFLDTFQVIIDAHTGDILSLCTPGGNG